VRGLRVKEEQQLLNKVLQKRTVTGPHCADFSTPTIIKAIHLNSEWVNSRRKFFADPATNSQVLGASEGRIRWGHRLRGQPGLEKAIRKNKDC
jgi:hypothetical protein